jgi:acyl-coenzyme A thioesterase PaaI-like protein
LGELEEKIERRLRKHLPIYEYMDFKVESASEGVYRCAVPLNAKNENHFHTVHAALQWASVEALGGLIWYATKPPSDGWLPVVRRFEIDFKRPARSNIVAETFFPESEAKSLRAALVENGRFDFALESTIRDVAGETVATAKGFYAVRAVRTDS